MRVLHSAALLTPGTGIVNQMTWEQEAARKLGLDWDTRLFCPDRGAGIIHVPFAVKSSGPAQKVSAWFSLRSAYAAWLRSVESKYDVVLLRYYVHDPYQHAFVTKSTRPVYFVHHTLEASELKLGGPSGYVRAFGDRLIGDKTVRSAAGLIGVTAEIAAWQVQRAGKGKIASFVYPNGIMSDAKDLLPEARGDIPHILFVASEFFPWHGLDLLLDDLSRFPGNNFRLHVVGRVNAQLRRQAADDSRVTFHGSLVRAELALLAQSCWVGLSSFALSRNGMEQACTLKVREYLSQGIPVYCGYAETLPTHFPFVRRGPAKIGEILRYCNEVRNVARLDVRESAMPYIDKAELLIKLYHELKFHHESTNAGG